MKINHLIIWLLCCCHVLPAWAQLTTDDTQTIDAVIQSLVGNGVTVSNIQKNCPDGAWGAFLGEESNLGMPKGLILTSGKIQNAEGPNASGSTSQSNLAPGDADLDDLIVGFTSQDACVVTFDLQAIADTIQFNYVFGSEEYLEYVNSNFNDVFGFFISGPNPAGGSYDTQNIALIPGTNTPVSINNVNTGSYPEYYIENGDGFSSPENTDNFYIQYDGFTTVLTARAAVVPCQTYTLKLAVADAGDTSLDSGVFIEAGSLTTNKIELSATTSLADLGFTSAVEGCIDALIQFKPSGTVIDTTIVFFDLTGSAQNGVDYTDENGLALPDSIILYPGDTIAQITLAPVIDGISEGVETVAIQISNTNFCATIVDTVEISIQDNIQASAAPANIGTCPGNNVNLLGVGGITSQWVPPTFLSDATIPNPVCTPTQSMMYTYITTVGPCVDSATVNVLIDDDFNPNVPSEYNLCPGQTNVSLSANGGTFVLWTPATDLSCSDCPNPIFNGTSNASYTVSLFDLNGCQSTYPVNIVYGNGDLGLRDSTLSLCAGQAVQWTLGSASASYTILPATGLSCDNCSNPIFTATQSITYQISAAVGSCQQSATWTVSVDAASADAGSNALGCQTVTATLGTPAQSGNTYAWLPTTNLSDATAAQPSVSLSSTTPITQTYTLQVTNANGCSATDVVDVQIATDPVLSIAQPDTLIEGNSTTLSVSGGGNGATYVWEPNTHLGSPNAASTTASPSESTTYTVTVTTAEGCSSSTSVSITVIEPPRLLVPSSFSPNNDDHNDILRIVGRDIAQITTFEVFNRWGQRVFQTSQLTDGWDGKWNGIEQEIGTYAYFVQYSYDGTETKTLKGNVTLLR